MSKRTPRLKRVKAAARESKAPGIVGPTRKRRRPRPKSLVAGRSGPHPRFRNAPSEINLPPAQERQKPPSRTTTGKAKKQAPSKKRDQRATATTSSPKKVKKVPRKREPVVSVFGRRLTPRPKPRI